MIQLIQFPLTDINVKPTLLFLQAHSSLLHRTLGLPERTTHLPPRTCQFPSPKALTVSCHSGAIRMSVFQSTSAVSRSDVRVTGDGMNYDEVGVLSLSTFHPITSGLASRSFAYLHEFGRWQGLGNCCHGWLANPSTAQVTVIKRVSHSNHFKKWFLFFF